MNFQRTAQSNAFPQHKRKSRSSKSTAVKTSLKSNNIQSISFLLSNYNDRYCEIASDYNSRNVKPSTAPQRTFRRFKQLKQQFIQHINEQQKRMIETNVRILRKQKQQKIWHMSGKHKAKRSQRNQLIYLQPHRRCQDKSLPLSKVKSQLYKQIYDSVIQNLNQQAEKNRNQTSIIQYLTQYQQKDGYRFLNYIAQLKSKPEIKKIENENLKALQNSTESRILEKQKQNVQKSNKALSINVLKQKFKNRTKNSLYISKIRTIKAQHQLKTSAKYKSFVQTIKTQANEQQ